MEWIFLIFGALIAAAISAAGGATPGLAIVGGASGWLLGMILRQRNLLQRLEIKLASLERQLQLQQRASASRKPEESTAAEPAARAAAPRPTRTPYETTSPAAQSPTQSSTHQGTSREEAQADADFSKSSKTESATGEASSSKPAASAKPPRPDIFQLGLRWFLSGNVPAKVGVIISFFGVSFLLKYAVDVGYVSFSPAMRVIAVLLFAAALLWAGWRLRVRQRAYSMALFGGGIGLMYLAFFASFRLYQLVPATFAFFLMALVAAFSVWLAVRERAFVLAGLGVTGGFLAPLLASTGSGSHVALFSYYLLINIGIATVAYFQHWRLLNLIGFAFTFIIGLAWGAEYYETRYFASVEPFLLTHFLLYVLVAVLSALRQPFRFKGYVDSALVFGLPLIVFPLQSGLVDDFERGMAWSSLGLGVFYCAMWFALRRLYATELKMLLQAFLALGVIFMTVAVPLWFDAPWVSGTWALEGAGMIWIGLFQRRELTRWAGVGLLLAALPALLMQLDHLDTSRLLLNARFFGLAIIALSALLAARLHELADSCHELKTSDTRSLAEMLAWGGLVLWLIAGAAEISEHVAHLRVPSWSVFLVSMTGAACSALAWVLTSGIFKRLALGVAAILPVLAIFSLIRLAHPAAEFGWLAWVLAFGSLYLLRRKNTQDDLFTCGVVDTLTLWTAFLLLPMEVHWLAGEYLPGRLWNEALALAAAAGMILLLLRWQLPRNPIFERFGLQAVMLVTVMLMIGIGFENDGGQSPLPYIPLLNGIAAASALVLFATWRLFRSELESRLELLAAFSAVALLTLTQEIARATHQFAAVRYDFSTMLGSDIFQAAVSIVWSIVGLAAMGYGTRLAMRHAWLAGAILMSCVVLKLFAIDLGNTGTVARIVSFVAVGVLLLIVGYLAPAPARNSRPARTSRKES